MPAAAAPRRPALTEIDDREVELWRSFKSGDKGARLALFDLYQPLARKIAARFMRNDHVTPVEFAELCQLANVGLLEAIDAYKPELGVPFRFFGNRRIRGSILNGIAVMNEVNQQISFRKRLSASRLQSLKPDSVKPATLEDALELLGDIAAGLAVGMMIDDSGMYMAEDVEPGRDAYETLAWKESVARVKRALDGLPDREKAIISFHYLQGVDFREIASLHGLTKGRVSQLHRSAIALLRKRLLDSRKFRLEG